MEEIVDCTPGESKQSYRATFRDGEFNCKKFTDGVCLVTRVRCPVLDVLRTKAEVGKNARSKLLSSLN